MTITFVIAQCPHCNQANRVWSIASLATFSLTCWSDGWWESQFTLSPVLSCAHCQQQSLAISFNQLGFLIQPQQFGNLQLLEKGHQPTKVIKLLREIFQWTVSETKSKLQKLPLLLYQNQLASEIESLAQQLTDIGAHCQSEIWSEGESAPPDWLNAPEANYIDDLEQLFGFLAQYQIGDDEKYFRHYMFQRCNNNYRNNSSQRWQSIDLRDVRQQHNANRLIELLSVDRADELILKAEIYREQSQFEQAINILNGVADRQYQMVLDYLLMLARNHNSRLLPLPISLANISFIYN